MAVLKINKEKENKYIFAVAKEATKGQIKDAVQTLFKVPVKRREMKKFVLKLRQKLILWINTAILIFPENDKLTQYNQNDR